MTSELTDAEREALWVAHTQPGPHFNRIIKVAESLIEARVAEALTKQQEGIAAAIEASPIPWTTHEHYQRGVRRGIVDAAEIARDYQPKEA